MTALDDSWDRVYKTTQAYNYKKREEACVPSTTKEEALKNGDQLIESEKMAKLKAERKGAKKKRQKEKKRAEKVNNGEENQTSTNLATTDVIAETVEESEDETSEGFDQDEEMDDELLDFQARFVQVSLKQNKNIGPNKVSVPKAKKVSPPVDWMSTPMPKFIKPKITKNQSDTAEALGMESCDFILNNNDFDKAINCLSQAIFLAPEDVRHFLNRSYCYLRLGQFALALSDARFAKKKSQLTEHFAKAVAREGQALYGLGQYHEAEKCFEEVLKLEDGNDWILTELILARVFQLTNMGFSKIDALKALHQCSAVVDAVTLLTSGSISSPELESSMTKSEIESNDGDEIYFSDDESSTTILLSKLVSGIADQFCYLENLRSQPLSSKTQQCSNSFGGTLKSSASLESLAYINGTKPKSNIQSKFINNFKSVPASPRTQIEKPVVSDSSSIWVGSIDKTITEHELRELFGVCGKINYIRRFPDERNYVFIEFDSKKAANKALNNINDFEIHGIKLPVKPALGYSGKK